jgi:hypothetical protein
VAFPILTSQRVDRAQAQSKARSKSTSKATDKSVRSTRARSKARTTSTSRAALRAFVVPTFRKGRERWGTHFVFLWTRSQSPRPFGFAQGRLCPCKERRDKGGAPALFPVLGTLTAEHRRKQDQDQRQRQRTGVSVLHEQGQRQDQRQRRRCGRSWFPPFGRLRAGSFAKDAKDGAPTLFFMDAKSKSPRPSMVGVSKGALSADLG